MATTVAQNESNNPVNPGGARRASTPEELPHRMREAVALVSIGACVFLLAALATYDVEYRQAAAGKNVCGWIGQVLARTAFVIFGKAAYVPLVFAAVWSLILFLRGRVESAVVKAFGVGVLTFGSAVFLELRRGGAGDDIGGGLLGHSLTPRIAAALGSLGSYLVLFVLCAIAFTLATDFAFVPLLREATRGVKAAAGEARDRAVEVRQADSWKARLLALVPGVLRGKPKAPKIKITDGASGGASPERPRFEIGGSESSSGGKADAPKSESVVILPRGGAKAGAEASDASNKSGAAAVDDELEPLGEFSEGLGLPGAPKGAAPKATRKKKDDPSPKLPFPAPEYKLPETKLLDEAKKVRLVDANDEMQAMAERIEQVMRSFGIDVKVVSASRGPAVTLFEMELGEGVTVNTLTARRYDLAIRLKSGGVRFVYPIPGKSTVGVEIPNTRREFVRLRELLDETPPNKVKAAVPLYLGRDVMNRSVVEDVTEMPHLLIAGQTGSGKSACLNAILCSVLLARTPDEVKLILVDPKQVEFAKYDGVPHLMCPIVTVARKVPIVLDWVIAEMEERYTLLAQAGVRKISDFNAISKKELKERLGENYDPEETRLRLPYLVVVVDEMNDLMVQAKKDMEDRITRIAQKSRAVGIHLILATQRPSVNVITGTIKANLPTRIAFQTAQGNDSRVILDQIGAEDLLGKGDFLYKPPGTDKFIRAQGTWVGDEEIDRLVKHARSLAEPQYDIRLVQIKDAPESGGDDGEAPVEASFESGAKDALFDRAVEETLQANRAAASHLQRAFSIGYNRATRIIDAMAALGIVSAYEGSKVRRILVTPEEWAARKQDILKGALKGKPMGAAPESAEAAE